MLKRLLFFICLLPLAAAGQYHITGRVIDKDTKKPVAFASVILNNTMVGAQTADDGSFTLIGGSLQFDGPLWCQTLLLI